MLGDDKVIDLGRCDTIRRCDSASENTGAIAINSVGPHLRSSDGQYRKGQRKNCRVPEHGPVGDKAQLIEFRDMLHAVREDEIVATKPTAASDQKWGGFVINGATFTKVVYAGV